MNLAAIARRCLHICCLTAALGGTAESSTLRLAVSAPALAKGDPFDRYTGGSIKSALFDGLTQISLSGEVTPALASSWTLVNATEWRFVLRPGVSFRNGAPVTAAGVAAVFAHLQSTVGSTSWMARQFVSIRAVKPIDDLTLTIVTTAPDPLLPRRLSMVNIIDMAAWTRMGAAAFARDPMGTGPYRVVSWGPDGSDIRLAAIANAWRAAGDVRAVEMKLLTEGSRRVQALLSGEVDLAVNLDPDSLNLLRDEGFMTQVIPNPIVVAIGLRTVDAGDSPLRDARVRQALNYAVDKTALSQQVLAGLMPVASQGVTPGVVGYNPRLAPYPFDPARARALLAEAGYPGGFKMVMGIWTGQVPGDALMFQQVAQDLARVGVSVRLQVLPFQHFSRRRTAGDWEGFDAFSVNWTSRPMFDAMNALESYSCRGTAAPFFCDAAVDAAVSLARHEMNPAVRTRRLEDAMEQMVATAPSIFLVNYSDIVAMRRSVTGYQVRSDGILFERMSIVPSAGADQQH